MKAGYSEGSFEKGRKTLNSPDLAVRLSYPLTTKPTFCFCCSAEQTETANDQFHEYLSIRSLRLGRTCERADVAGCIAEGVR